MLLKIVYLLVRQVLGLVILMFCGDGAKEAELLALRHERGAAPGVCGTGRLTGCGSPLWPGFSPADAGPISSQVTPATLLAWHRKLAARKYDTSGRREPGRPPVVRSITRLAVRLAGENPPRPVLDLPGHSPRTWQLPGNRGRQSRTPAGSPQPPENPH